MESESLTSTIIVPLKKKCRLQQVFGDKLKVEEKLQVLNALISACEQKSDLAVGCHPKTNSSTDDVQLKNQSQEQGSYPCGVCCKSFDSSSQYYGHLAMHKREEFCWTCVKCPNGTSFFKSLAHLRKHENSCHFTSKEYKCKYCNDTFHHSSSREAHQNDMHSEHARFACQFCDKTFYKRSDLRTHLATHLALQGSVCEVCGRSFSHISNLIRHSYLHTGVKPYPCKTCGRRFTQLSSLKQHKISHHENLAIPCPALPLQCGKVFRTPILARQHAYRMHPGILWEKSIPQKCTKLKQRRNYYCRDCGETFQFAKDLKCHNLEHQKNQVSEKDLENDNHARNTKKNSSESLQFSSEKEHADGLLEDYALKIDRQPVDCSADDFPATSQEMNCASFSFGSLDMYAIASSDSSFAQQITIPAFGSSEPNSEFHLMEGSVPDDNESSFLYKLKGEQTNQFPGTESVKLEKVMQNHQATEVAYLQTVDHGQCASTELQYINAEGKTARCNELAEYQYLRTENDKHNNNQTEPLSVNNDNEDSNELTVLSSLGMHNNDQRLGDDLKDLKYMNVHRIHFQDSEIKMTEMQCILDNAEHVSHLTELQCLNIEETDPSADTFIPSYLDGTENEDTCSTMLNDLEHQDQCLSVNEDTCSTLLKELEYDNSCLQVTDDTCSNLLSGMTQVVHSNTENTKQICESIILSLPDDIDRESACSPLINEANDQHHCLNLHNGNGNSEVSLPLNPALSPIEMSRSSTLSETEQEDEHDNENALTPKQYFLTMEFSKEILSLLPETSDGPEEIVIYVSQEDGAPAEVRIKPIMTTVISNGNADASVLEKTDVQDSLQPPLLVKKKKKPNRTKRKCPECGKIFFKTSNLRQHLGTHFPNMQGYECDLCNQSFAWKSTLNKHMISTHAIVLRQYLCDLCGKQYNTITQVKEHKRRDHQSLRPNICNVCNKSFFRKYDLHIHQRIHSNKKPFMCGTCGKTFNHLSHIKRHESIHQSVQHYDCYTCGCSFTQQSALKLHWEKYPSCKL